MENRASKSIKLYSIPLNHRGSTEHLLREAIHRIEWPDYSDVIYIAPTPRKLRDAQKRFHALVRSPYIPPRFFTLKQLSKNLFETEMPGRSLPQILVPLLISDISGQSIGYSSILSNLLKELKQHHPLKGIHLIQQELTEIFKKLGIPDDALKRLNTALDIFEKYQNTLSDLNFYDENDILNYSFRQGMDKQSAAARVLDNFSVLIADGFYDMTTSEKNLFGELIRKAEMTLISFPDNNSSESSRFDLSFITDGFIDHIKSNFNIIEEYFKENSRSDLSYIKYNGIEEEIEGIARHIKNLYITGCLKTEDSVIVTFPGISDYTELTERVFSRYGLPYSISLQKPALQKNALRDVLYLLESIAENFPRLKFTTVLSSSYFKNLPEVLKSEIPSLSLRSSIIKGKESWENISSIIKDKALAKSIKQDIYRIFDILDRLIKIKDSADFGAFHSEIERILSKLCFEAEQDDIDMLNNSMEIIGIISELSGKKIISLKRYAEFLRHVLGATEYSYEEEGIQIMDFLETRGLEPDHLYFSGLKDGNLPSKPSIDHLLPDSVRTEYSLINLSKYLSIQKLNFLRIVGASSNTHLSYPSIDGDKLFLPSPYLPWAKEIPENVFGVFSEEELQIRKNGRLLSDSIKEIRLDKKARNRLLIQELSMPISVTDIDYFRKCPRKFFIEKVLDLEAAEITEYEIEARMLGTILHSIMEELIKSRSIEILINRAQIEDIEAVKQKALSIISRILKDYTIENYWKRLIKEAFMEILPEIIDIESDLRKEGFMPYKLEMKVKEEVLPGISLKGKIDRIDLSRKGVDRCDDLYRVIDYKTGSVNIGAEIIKKGRELQLPLYAAMLKSCGMAIEKAGIYSLKETRIKWIPTMRDKNTLDVYISSALEYLKEIIIEIKEGRFRALPLEEFYCSSCAEAPFCPYINSGSE